MFNPTAFRTDIKTIGDRDERPAGRAARLSRQCGQGALAEDRGGFLDPAERAFQRLSETALTPTRNMKVRRCAMPARTVGRHHVTAGQTPARPARPVGAARRTATFRASACPACPNGRCPMARIQPARPAAGEGRPGLSGRRRQLSVELLVQTFASIYTWVQWRALPISPRFPDRGLDIFGWGPQTFDVKYFRAVADRAQQYRPDRRAAGRSPDLWPHHQGASDGPAEFPNTCPTARPIPPDGAPLQGEPLHPLWLPCPHIARTSHFHWPCRPRLLREGASSVRGASCAFIL